jgi:hypothetical protein
VPTSFGLLRKLTRGGRERAALAQPRDCSVIAERGMVLARDRGRPTDARRQRCPDTFAERGGGLCRMLASLSSEAAQCGRPRYRSGSDSAPQDVRRRGVEVPGRDESASMRAGGVTAARTPVHFETIGRLSFPVSSEAGGQRRPTRRRETPRSSGAPGTHSPSRAWDMPHPAPPGKSRRYSVGVISVPRCTRGAFGCRLKRKAPPCRFM